MLAKPKLLLLDEPMAGVNPALTQSLLDHILDLKEQGMTVLFVEHDMHMVRHIADWVVVMAEGKIVAEGSPRALKAEVGGDVVNITLDTSREDDGAGRAERAEQLLRERTYVDAVNRVDGAISITVKDGSAAVPDIVGLLRENQVPVAGLSVASPTLDDVFLKYTGRTIRSEEATGDEFGQMLRPMMGLNKKR